MQIDALIDRLKASCPQLKHVASTADFAQAKQLAKHQLPAVFVIPLAEQASPNGLAGSGFTQRIEQHFGLVIAISNLRDVGGAHAITDLYTIRQSVMQAVMAWQPAGADDVMQYSGGRLLDLSDQVLWWQDDYSISVYLRMV